MNTIFDKIEKTKPSSLIWVILIFGLIVYFGAFFNGFVSDDRSQILQNQLVHNVMDIPALFTMGTFNSGGAVDKTLVSTVTGHYYKPLMPVFYTLVYVFFGPNPFYFHGLSILLHLINTVLLYIFFRRLFLLHKVSFPNVVSFSLSLIFLVHPVNVETVAYIPNMQDLLYFLFTLLTFHLALSYFTVEGRTKKNLFLLGLSTLCALLSKESAIIIFPLLFIYCFLFYRNKTKPVSITLLIVLCIYSILRFVVAGIPLSSGGVQTNNGESVGFVSRILTVPYQVGMYATFIFYPIHYIYSTTATFITSILDPRFYILFLLLIIVGLLIGVFLAKVRSKLGLFFFMWTIVALALIVNVFPLDGFLAKRWMYGVLVGMLGFLGVFLSMLLRKMPSFKTIFLIISVIMIVLLSGLSMMRVKDWQNDLTVAANDIHYQPNDFNSNNYYAQALLSEGEYKESIVYFKKARSINPNSWIVYANLGYAYQKEGQIEEAKKTYRIAIHLGNYFQTYENLANLMLETDTVDNTIQFIQNAFVYYPNNVNLNRIMALAYLKKGIKSQAIIYARKAYTLDPTDDNYSFLQQVIQAQ